MACPDCGGTTVWDDDAASAICTACGSLTDPSQTRLADVDTWGEPSWTGTSQAATLKSLRFQQSNWDLAGQGKEARDRKNQVAMGQFITSLAVSLNAPGLTPRATILFNQAMAAGKFRWGRKAKLVAGATLAVALREYRRPDSLNDIAYLLDEQCPILVRTLTAVVSLLGITLAPVDPSIHIPSLLTSLTSLVTTQSQSLPAPIIAQLKPMSLRSVSNTATALSTLLTRLGPDHPINSLPTPPTAVALFLLAIEGESRTPLPQIGELAQCLGATCHKTSRGVVMARYKLVQDIIATWAEQVPWLGKYEQKTKSNGKNRAKVGKRSIVAKGIADVVQFQDEIWKGKLKPSLVLEADDEGNELLEDVPDHIKEPSESGPNELTARLPKRQKVAHHPLRDATQFLLNPLAAPVPTCETPPRPTVRSQRPQIQTQLEPSFQSNARQTHTPFLLSPPPFQNNAHYATQRYSTMPPSLRVPAPQISTQITPPEPPTTAVPPQVAPADSSTPHQEPSTSTETKTAPNPRRTAPASLSSLSAYILAAPTLPSLHSRVLPTRLQLLTAVRGDADGIRDEELFAEGELEGLFRSETEAEEMGQRMIGVGIWDEEEEGECDVETKRKEKRGKRGNDQELQKLQEKKSRVDLEALSRFLKEVGDGEGKEDKGEERLGDYDAALLGLERFDDKDSENEDFIHHIANFDDGTTRKARGSSSKVTAAVEKRKVKISSSKSGKKNGSALVQGRSIDADDGSAVVLNEWRPLSPEPSSGFGHRSAGNDGDRYEQECD